MPDGAAMGFIHAMYNIIKNIKIDNRDDIIAMKELVDEKYQQLKKIHKHFDNLIRALNSAVTTAHRDLDANQHIVDVLKTLRASLEEVHTTRSSGRVQRRSMYEEAHVYAEQSFQERGIFVKIPGNIAASLTLFMSNYCSYFEREGEYFHDLDGVMKSIEKNLEKLEKFYIKQQKEIEIERLHLTLKGLESECLKGVDRIWDKWPVFARAYYTFTVVLREHGYSDIVKKT
jgi:hypothetical protein